MEKTTTMQVYRSEIEWLEKKKLAPREGLKEVVRRLRLQEERGSTVADGNLITSSGIQPTAGEARDPKSLMEAGTCA